MTNGEKMLRSLARYNLGDDKFNDLCRDYILPFVLEPLHLSCENTYCDHCKVLLNIWQSMDTAILEEVKQENSDNLIKKIPPKYNELIKVWNDNTEHYSYGHFAKLRPDSNFPIGVFSHGRSLITATCFTKSPKISYYKHCSRFNAEELEKLYKLHRRKLDECNNTR